MSKLEQEQVRLENLNMEHDDDFDYTSYGEWYELAFEHFDDIACELDFIN
jgi:hypothetical protein